MKESYSMKIFPTYNLFQSTTSEKEPISYQLNDYQTQYKSPKKESKQLFPIQTSSLFPIQEKAYNENTSTNNEIISNSDKPQEIINTIYSSQQPIINQKKYFQRNQNDQISANKSLFNSYFYGNLNNLQRNQSTININKLTLNKINYLDNEKNKPIEEKYVIQNENAATPKNKNKTILLNNFNKASNNNKFLSPDVNKYMSKFNNIINDNEKYNNNMNNTNRYPEENSNDNKNDNFDLSNNLDDILNIALETNINDTMNNLTNEYLDTNKNENSNNNIININNFPDVYRSIDFSNNFNNNNYTDIKNKNNSNNYFSNLMKNNDFKINDNLNEQNNNKKNANDYILNTNNSEHITKKEDNNYFINNNSEYKPNNNIISVTKSVNEFAVNNNKENALKRIKLSNNNNNKFILNKSYDNYNIKNIKANNEYILNNNEYNIFETSNEYNTINNIEYYNENKIKNQSVNNNNLFNFDTENAIYTNVESKNENNIYNVEYNLNDIDYNLKSKDLNKKEESNNININLNDALNINSEENNINDIDYYDKIIEEYYKNNNNEYKKNNDFNNNNIIINTNIELDMNKNLNTTQEYNNNNNNNNNNSQNKEIEPDSNFNLSEFEKLKEIGEGTEGTIYSVKWRRNNKIYALKKGNLSTMELVKKRQEEIQMLKNFRKKTGSDGVIRIYDILFIKNEWDYYNFYEIMELADIDWENEIINRGEIHLYYEENELLEIMAQIVRTMALLQKNHITHRDIKPQNIMIVKGRFKICDFGNARILKREGLCYQRIRGSEMYMSPIMFKGYHSSMPQVKHHTFKSDVFSLGMCFLLAAALSYIPLNAIREVYDMNVIKKIMRHYLGNRYSDRIFNIILLMLQVEEIYRPDFIQLEKQFVGVSNYL